MTDTHEEMESGMTSAERKLFNLRMKINAGRKANKKEVAAEHERLVIPNKKRQKEVMANKWEVMRCSGTSQTPKKKTTKEFITSCEQEEKKQEVLAKAHLSDTANDADEKAKKEAKKQKKRAAFGWEAFNQDSLYRAYKKRLVNLPTLTENATPMPSSSSTDELSYGKHDKVDEKALDRMAEELEERAKARAKFSRRRQHFDSEDVDYINRQNQVFNRKATKAFDKYTVEIRQNLERGTAL